MKKSFLFLTVLALIFYACKKTDARYGYMQGTWDVQQFLVNGADSTTVVKTSKYYAPYICNVQHADNYLQFLGNGGASSGPLGCENNNYASLHIESINFNNALWVSRFNQGIDWSINNLTNSSLTISTGYKGVSYKITYSKK